MSDPAAQGRREVRIGVATVPAALDPASALDGDVPLIARQLYDTLVQYRETSTDVEPALALRWTVSRDGLVWSFTLRDNVRFQDGTPLTATEVVQSFSAYLSRPGQEGQTGSPVWATLLRGVPGVVREVRAADARTVQFVLAQPYAPLLSALAHPGLGVVRRVTGTDSSVRLIGTGPYRIAEATSGRLILEAAPGYWKGSARTERLVFLEVGADEQAESAFDSGSVDVWFPQGPPRRVDGVLSTPGLRVGYLAFQTEKEPFSKKKIRQAVAAALDPAVVGVALGRAAVPLQSFLPPGVWARREGSPVLGGTREAVKKLVAEAGWPKGFSGTLIVPDEAAPVNLPKLGETLQQQLGNVDMPVQVRIEPAEAVSAARQTGQHDLTLAERVVLAGDPHFLLYPLSTSEGATKGPRALNFSFYRNPRLDDILARASQLAFRPERQRLYERAQAMLSEDLPWIPIFVRLVWGVARPEVKGLRLHPTGVHRLDTVWIESGASGLR